MDNSGQPRKPMASLSGSNSAVECQLPKLDVAGSIPVSRSIEINNLGAFPRSQVRPLGP